MSIWSWNSDYNLVLQKQKKKKTEVTLNAMILVTLKKFIFSNISPSQADGWKWQVSIFNQKKEVEKSDLKALKRELKK